MSLPLPGIYTIVNPRTGGHRTIQLRADDFAWMTYNRPPAGSLAIRGLNGPDNEQNFVYLGDVSPSGIAHFTRKASLYPTLVAAAQWLIRNGSGREASLAKAYALRSGRCSFCNRRLTTPASITAGYGPDCAEQNSLPWGGPSLPLGPTDPVTAAEEVASAAAARVGWQTVTANPPRIDGYHKNDITPRRTYSDLFPDD